MIIKEYSQYIEGYPTFRFNFPASMGEYVKYSTHVFELRKDNIQKIRVTIFKCQSEEKLEESTRNWIEECKRSNNMEEISYKKEKIGNIPLEVYELRYIKTRGIKLYKTGYLNGCRITISGGKVPGKEKIINDAFASISCRESQQKREDSFDITMSMKNYAMNKIKNSKEEEIFLSNKDDIIGNYKILNNGKIITEKEIEIKSCTFKYKVPITFEGIEEFKIEDFDQIKDNFDEKIYINNLNKLLSSEEYITKKIISFVIDFYEEDPNEEVIKININATANISDKNIWIAISFKFEEDEDEMDGYIDSYFDCNTKELEINDSGWY